MLYIEQQKYPSSQLIYIIHLYYCIQSNIDSILDKLDSTTLFQNIVIILIICMYILCLDEFESTRA